MGLLKQEEINDAVSGEVVFANDFVSVASVGGDQTAVTVGSGRGAVALVLWKGKALMCRTPRYATGSMEWELPRGTSLEDESSFDTAARCVEGLTGIIVDAKAPVLLGTMTPDSEVLTNEVELLLLTSSSGAVRTNHEHSKWVEVEELVNACLEGEIEDSFTCMAVLRARLNGII